MDTPLEILKSAEIFRDLTHREMETLASVSLAEQHRPRTFLFMEGDPALWLYLVRGGRVKILKHSRTGKDVVLEILGPGEVVGGVAVLEGRPYPASAQALEAAAVLKIPREPLLALTESHPDIVRRMVLLIGQRLRGAHESMRALAAEPVEQRLAAALLRLVEREGVAEQDGSRLPYRLTRQSLAEMAGTTVETTIRVLSRWGRDGLLADEDGRLLLRDLHALRARASGESAAP